MGPEGPASVDLFPLSSGCFSGGLSGLARISTSKVPLWPDGISLVPSLQVVRLFYTAFPFEIPLIRTSIRDVSPVWYFSRVFFF